MLVKIFKIIFGKFIGLNGIPKEKRERIAKATLFVAKELVEAGARGASDGELQGIVAKFKKEF